jgi:hypothetical protein
MVALSSGAHCFSSQYLKAELFLLRWGVHAIAWIQFLICFRTFWNFPEFSGISGIFWNFRFLSDSGIFRDFWFFRFLVFVLI